MSEDKESSPVPNTYDIENPKAHKEKKQNRFKNVLGKIMLGAMAVSATAGTTRASVEGDPTQPVKDVVNVTRQLSKTIIPAENKDDSAFVNQISAAAVTKEAEGGVTGSTERTDTGNLNRIYNEFTNDLKQIPSAVMGGMSDANLEGYRVSIDDKVYRFVKPRNQDSEKTITIDSDENTINLIIKGDEISKSVIVKGDKKIEEENYPTLENVTKQLTEALEKWRIQKKTATPDSRFPTPTPAPFNPNPDPFNRGDQQT